MSKKCSYCEAQVEQVKYNKINMRICPHCYATFISAKSFMAVRRDIDELSRQRLMEFLRANSAVVNFEKDINCIDHGKKLVDGKLPDYVIPAKIPTCCDIQHLPPQLWGDLLERGLKNPLLNIKSSKYDSGSALNRLRRFVQNILDKDYTEEDPFDGLFYSIKIEPILKKSSSKP
ncbi:MAG: hypothetical protein GX801_11265 [Fibrobacter sp.]|mgnify:CR=1 FL=1|nr:hypothetical protein [Fibrobacter sp.]